MLDVILDALIDSIKLLPFLLITYIIMEYIEHQTGKKTRNVIKKSGKFGPFLGAVLGIFPQCGFSAAASNLYAGKVLTTGTLIAIYLSTSDEMLPVLISEAVPLPTILRILAIKLVIGMLAGFGIDLILEISKNRRKPKERQEEIEKEIGYICEHEHCHCEEGILKSAIKHTVNIFLYIIIVTLVVNVFIYFIGEENLANLILNKPILGPVISGIIGLIPNCAGSVILTQLYLEGVISFGAVLGGLLVGSGIGILVLFRVNKNLKQNFKILGFLYAIGTICGIIIDFIQ